MIFRIIETSISDIMHSNLKKEEKTQRNLHYILNFNLFKFYQNYVVCCTYAFTKYAQY